MNVFVGAGVAVPGYETGSGGKGRGAGELEGIEAAECVTMGMRSEYRCAGVRRSARNARPTCGLHGPARLLLVTHAPLKSTTLEDRIRAVARPFTTHSDHIFSTNKQTQHSFICDDEATNRKPFKLNVIIEATQA
ncbi:hypothetical protein RR46_09352 [Papilio xuthus]|uniref:Uncharacterized protein n=1 Tax=Papilio xuthus TaxID=66420 RepID=A0A194Q211_PAPXU|nr:hypothetical protein RR46_09352 [Papilio xuthus]